MWKRQRITRVLCSREMCLWNVSSGQCVERATLPYRHTAICVSALLSERSRCQSSNLFMAFFFLSGDLTSLENTLLEFSFIFLLKWKNITSNHLLFWPSSQSKNTGQQHLFLVISFLCLIFKNEFHIVSHFLSDTKASMYTWEDSASTMHYFIQHETLSGSEEMAQGLRAFTTLPEDLNLGPSIQILSPNQVQGVLVTSAGLCRQCTQIHIPHSPHWCTGAI